MDHRAYRELAAGDAMGDLSRVERLRFRVHALRCKPCAALRRDLDDTTAMLSLAPVQRRAPAALWEAILRSIAADRRSAAPPEPVHRQQDSAA